jgi:hypothetical protein
MATDPLQPKPVSEDEQMRRLIAMSDEDVKRTMEGMFGGKAEEHVEEMVREETPKARTPDGGPQGGEATVEIEESDLSNESVKQILGRIHDILQHLAKDIADEIKSG